MNRSLLNKNLQKVYNLCQVQKFEKERHDYDANLSKLKETVASQKQEIVDLLAQVR